MSTFTQQNVDRFPIFFADDHGLIREAISQILHQHFPKVDIFETGSFSALVDSIAAYKPPISVNEQDSNGVILTDLTMPGMSIPKGINELTRRFPEYPVVVLSGMFTIRDVYLMIDCGVKALIPKTAKPALLLHVIGLVLDGEGYFPIDALKIHRSTEEELSEMNPLAALTNREREIAKQIANGLSNKEIARKIGITEGTIKVNVKGIFKKMEVKNRTLLAKVLYDFEARTNTP